jgi:hypothetical protein
LSAASLSRKEAQAAIIAECRWNRTTPGAPKASIVRGGCPFRVVSASGDLNFITPL